MRSLTWRWTVVALVPGKCHPFIRDEDGRRFAVDDYCQINFNLWMYYGASGTPPPTHGLQYGFVGGGLWTPRP